MDQLAPAALEALRIRDLGVIDDVEIEFGPGLNVVTGETGAGKTMVVTALQLLFGGRGDASRVRTGADQASVEGRLVLAADSQGVVRALDAGGAVEDGELLLRRVLTAAGRSRAQVGGTSAPVGILAAIGEQVYTVHGQSDQLRLSQPAAQRQALDGYAGVDIGEYRSAFTRWQETQAELTRRQTDTAALRREAELLAHGLREIEAVAPTAGEDRDLAVLTSRLDAADELRRAGRLAHDALLGDPEETDPSATDVRSLLAQARAELTGPAGHDAELAGLAGRLADIQAMTAELGADLSAYVDGIDADPLRLEQAQQRRSELAALIRKYAPPPADGSKPDLAGVLGWAEQAQRRLLELDTSDEAIASLSAERDRARAAAATAAEAVRGARQSAAARLAAAVTTELQGLAMADAAVEFVVSARPPLAGSPTLTVAGEESGASADGVDDVEIRLRPRPDSPSLPIQKGASGGELSRVMLALEVVLAGTDPVPLMIFDEVDAGVGGRAAVEVGRRLAQLGGDHQVIVVTHLPQVAAYADHHLVVAPDPERGVASSDVMVVTADARVAELARMLAGRDTRTARQHAAELLREAQRS